MATGAKLKDLLKSAADAISDIKDEEMKRIAFERVLDHLLKTDDSGSAAGNGARDSLPTDEATVDSSLASEQQRIDEVASYFGIGSEQVSDLFDLSEENPRLLLSSGELSESKAQGTREIALLITGVRTALGRDTHTDHIRGVADYYGKLDSKNFMKILNSMPHLALLGKPRSPNRAVRMKVRGAEESANLVQSLVSE